MNLYSWAAQAANDTEANLQGLRHPLDGAQTTTNEF